MAQKIESKWQTLRNFIDGYLQENINYRAGAIYEAYLNDGGLAEITRKDFEMFLRDQVMKDDGLLKRVSHGVYAIRNNPDDRGILFSRTKIESNPKTLDVTLNEIFDDTTEIATKINSAFENLDKLDGVSFPAQMELKRLKALLNNSMDTALTGVSTVMAWCEDNIEIEPQPETETIQTL